MSQQEPTQIDIAIIGGGIVGLWICKELLRKFPNYHIAIFEKENYLFEHTSGRNSEVLHSGIYYPTNSLKHMMCIEGNILWKDYLKTTDIRFLNCGKYIVSHKDTTLQIDELFEKAKKNNVPNIYWADQKSIRKLSDYVKVTKAFFSPSTGILDVATIGKTLRTEIENKGGIVLMNTRVISIESVNNAFLINLSNGDKISTQITINSCGLNAIETRGLLGLKNYQNFYVKGNYLALTTPIPLKNLIYPIPPTDKLGLGVHLTLDIDGNQKFGPNSEFVDQISYNSPNNLIETMLPSIKELFHTIKREHLNLAYSGIRPKIKNDKGDVIQDFIIESPIKNYIELLGIESPGLTSAPAIAKYIANKL